MGGRTLMSDCSRCYSSSATPRMGSGVAASETHSQRRAALNRGQRPRRATGSTEIIWPDSCSTWDWCIKRSLTFSLSWRVPSCQGSTRPPQVLSASTASSRRSRHWPSISETSQPGRSPRPTPRRLDRLSPPPGWRRSTSGDRCRHSHSPTSSQLRRTRTLS